MKRKQGIRCRACSNSSRGAAGRLTLGSVATVGWMTSSATWPLNCFETDGLIDVRCSGCGVRFRTRVSSDNPRLNAFCRVAPSVRFKVQARGRSQLTLAFVSAEPRGLLYEWVDSITCEGDGMKAKFSTQSKNKTVWRQLAERWLRVADLVERQNTLLVDAHRSMKHRRKRVHSRAH